MVYIGGLHKWEGIVGVIIKGDSRRSDCSSYEDVLPITQESTIQVSRSLFGMGWQGRCGTASRKALSAHGFSVYAAETRVSTGKKNRILKFPRYEAPKDPQQV